MTIQGVISRLMMQHSFEVDKGKICDCWICKTGREHGIEPEPIRYLTHDSQLKQKRARILEDIPAKEILELLEKPLEERARYLEKKGLLENKYRYFDCMGTPCYWAIEADFKEGFVRRLLAEKESYQKEKPFQGDQK